MRQVVDLVLGAGRMTTEQIRAADAKAITAYLSGATEHHPHGWSGKRWIIPPQSSCSTWDTSPNGWKFSEWGNAAGAV